MKFLDEFRDRALVEKLARQISEVTSRPWKLMEVCGGQTHAFVKFGLQRFLPEGVELVHGPGCPVCVTPVDILDSAMAIAGRDEVIFCSFGDMLRVPGTDGSLLRAKAAGADIRIVYSPMDALEIARQHPAKEVVFLGVGFETTAPANAMAIYQAAQDDLANFSIIISHFLVPPAIEAISSARDTRVDGYLAAGHVCTVMGYQEYELLAEKYHLPIVVTGFEPVDLLEGILMCIRMLEVDMHGVENQYARCVSREGNAVAMQMMNTVFTIVNQQWRGIGQLCDSGLQIADAYRRFDALARFGQTRQTVPSNSGCISGEIMQGLKKPYQCPHFGKACVPESPLGAPMVSSEGACAAYYRYAAFSEEAS